MTYQFLQTPETVITEGSRMFADSIAEQVVGVMDVDFTPPPADLVDALAKVMADPRRQEANELALARMLAAGAHVTDVVQAKDALGLQPGHFLHAGPPLTWERASGPMRGGLIAACLFEGLAEDAESAEALLSGNTVTLEPCHHHGAVGPMAGVVSPSMWMFELTDPNDGRKSWCSLNEGLGKVLRYGAYSEEVITRLNWMTEVLGPLLQAGVRGQGGTVDAVAILAQMIQMGDEAHNRNRAGTLMFMRDVLPAMIEAVEDNNVPGGRGSFTQRDVAEVVRFIGGNDHFFLNIAMPACKLITSAAANIPGSTVVTVMARNGTDFGIQVSGTGDQWFTGPANTPVGMFLGEYGPEDANPDIGDSAITETAGIGGFVMAAAPAIVRLVGGDVSIAIDATQRMYEITTGPNPNFGIPIFDFRGAPTGIDVAKVVTTSILPQINTGMAGRVAGTGQVGAGLVNPPEQCFAGAIVALAEAAPDLPTAPTSA